ncbi:hypothetical protein SBRCBS47491_002319 [Sporothrix bragantina]|uniref:PPM-type phosphatase domain-containing protein n=1 Tax=Sporothrix bragantina TaxID=671064 RepID=A0ABP0B5X9_9PEZI
MFSAARRPAALLARIATPTTTRRFASTVGSKPAPVPRRPNGKATAGLAGAVSLAASAGFLWWSPSKNEGQGMPDLDQPEGKHVQYSAFLPPTLTPDDVTRLLAQNAFSVAAPRGLASLTRYDGAQLASNSPCEDRLVHGSIASPCGSRNGGNRWAVWAVLDGHAGAATADVMSRALVPFVQHRLREACRGGTDADAGVIERAISQAFVDLDKAIMDTAAAAPASEASLASKVRTMMPAFSGSCALLALYDTDKGQLHVACTGDSRAVLGRQVSGGNGTDTWETLPLSVDQTGYNKDEVARLQAEHPGEDETIVKDGRVLGMAVSRAFGDSRWKWPVEFQESIRRRFYAPRPLTPTYDVRTPPYLKAEPVLTTVRLEPGQKSFLILASDGLWDHVKSNEAVDLVGRWLDPTAVPPASKAVASKADDKDEKKSEIPEGEPFDFGHFWKGVYYKFVPERTIVEDSNAAVHLIRNSLGGNHTEMLTARLTFGAPDSRRLRDDTTVQVAFFNC